MAVTKLEFSWSKIQALSTRVMARLTHGKSLSVRSPTTFAIVSFARAITSLSTGLTQFTVIKVKGPRGAVVAGSLAVTSGKKGTTLYDAGIPVLAGLAIFAALPVWAQMAVGVVLLGVLGFMIWRILKSISFIRALEGISSSRLLNRQEGENLMRGLTEAGALFYYAKLDVNKLGQLNKIYGKKIVNYALGRMFEVIVETLKGVDGFVYRIGGDEAGIVLVNANEKTAERILTDVYAEIANEFSQYVVYSIDNRINVLPADLSVLVEFSLVHAIYGGRFLIMFRGEDIAANIELQKRVNYYLQPYPQVNEGQGIPVDGIFIHENVSIGAVNSREVAAEKVRLPGVTPLLSVIEKRAEDALILAKESEDAAGRIKIGLYARHTHTGVSIFVGEMGRIIREKAFARVENWVENEKRLREIVNSDIEYIKLSEQEGTLVELLFTYTGGNLGNGRFKEINTAYGYKTGDDVIAILRVSVIEALKASGLGSSIVTRAPPDRIIIWLRGISESTVRILSADIQRRANNYLARTSSDIRISRTIAVLVTTQNVSSPAEFYQRKDFTAKVAELEAIEAGNIVYQYDPAKIDAIIPGIESAEAEGALAYIIAYRRGKIELVTEQAVAVVGQNPGVSIASMDGAQPKTANTLYAHLEEAKGILSGIPDLGELLKRDNRDRKLAVYVLAVLFILQNKFPLLNEDRYQKLVSRILSDAHFDEFYPGADANFRVGVPFLQGFTLFAREGLVATIAHEVTHHLLPRGVNGNIRECIADLGAFAIVEMMFWPREVIDEYRKATGYEDIKGDDNDPQERHVAARAFLQDIIDESMRRDRPVAWNTFLRLAMRIIRNKPLISFDDFKKSLVYEYRRISIETGRAAEELTILAASRNISILFPRGQKPIDRKILGIIMDAIETFPEGVLSRLSFPITLKITRRNGVSHLGEKRGGRYHFLQNAEVYVNKHSIEIFGRVIWVNKDSLIETTWHELIHALSDALDHNNHPLFPLDSRVEIKRILENRAAASRSRIPQIIRVILSPATRLAITLLDRFYGDYEPDPVEETIAEGGVQLLKGPARFETNDPEVYGVLINSLFKFDSMPLAAESNSTPRVNMVASRHNFTPIMQLLAAFVSAIMLQFNAAAGFLKAFRLGYKVTLYKLAKQGGIRGSPVRYIFALFYHLANNQISNTQLEDLRNEILTNRVLSKSDTNFLISQIAIHEEAKTEIQGLRNQSRSFVGEDRNTIVDYLKFFFGTFGIFIVSLLGGLQLFAFLNPYISVLPSIFVPVTLSLTYILILGFIFWATARFGLAVYYLREFGHLKHSYSANEKVRNATNEALSTLWINYRKDKQGGKAFDIYGKYTLAWFAKHRILSLIFVGIGVFVGLNTPLGLIYGFFLGALTPLLAMITVEFYASYIGENLEFVKYCNNNIQQIKDLEESKPLSGGKLWRIRFSLEYPIVSGIINFSIKRLLFVVIGQIVGAPLVALLFPGAVAIDLLNIWQPLGVFAPVLDTIHIQHTLASVLKLGFIVCTFSIPINARIFANARRNDSWFINWSLGIVSAFLGPMNIVFFLITGKKIFKALTARFVTSFITMSLVSAEISSVLDYSKVLAELNIPVLKTVFFEPLHTLLNTFETEILGIGHTFINGVFGNNINMLYDTLGLKSAYIRDYWL
ncbi:MAG: hypothetical protein Q7S42_04545, partial [Candidatus Omnitrophota bacterium]|nr:hypothetical protein [Candidatus Omnitrophota bacterium]